MHANASIDESAFLDHVDAPRHAPEPDANGLPSGGDVSCSRPRSTRR
jgi:hypothetical protein